VGGLSQTDPETLPCEHIWGLHGGVCRVRGFLLLGVPLCGQGVEGGHGGAICLNCGWGRARRWAGLQSVAHCGLLVWDGSHTMPLLAQRGDAPQTTFACLACLFPGAPLPTEGDLGVQDLVVSVWAEPSVAVCPGLAPGG